MDRHFAGPRDGRVAVSPVSTAPETGGQGHKLPFSRPSARTLNGAISVNFQFWASCLVIWSEKSTQSLSRPPKRSYDCIFGIYGRAEHRRIGAKNAFFATERTATVTARVDVRGNAPCPENVGGSLWHREPQKVGRIPLPARKKRVSTGTKAHLHACHAMRGRRPARSARRRRDRVDN